MTHVIALETGQSSQGTFEPTTLAYKRMKQIRFGSGVIGSDVPWLDCPGSNAIACVITVTE